MGTYTATATGTLTEWEGAAKWNHVITSGDSWGVVNGATLTIDAARPFLLGQSGANGDGSDPGAGNRAGNITVADGLTLTLDGSSTSTASGIKSNPAATGTETLDNLLTIGDGVVFTNSVGAYNTNNKYTIYIEWGGVVSTGTFTYKYAAANNTVGLYISCLTTRTNLTEMSIGNVTVTPGDLGNSQITCAYAVSAAADVPIHGGRVSFDMSATTTYNQILQLFYSNRIGYAYHTFNGVGVINVSAGRTQALQMNAGVTGNDHTNLYFLSFRYAESPLTTETVPTGLTLTNMYDGTIKVEVSNFAANTMLELRDGSGVVRYAIPYASYVALTDRKPANCGLVAGVPLSEISTWTARFTSDLFVYSDDCAAAAAVTPTFTPATNQVQDGVPFGQGLSLEGSLPSGSAAGGSKAISVGQG